jgi:hypothetical protein
VSRTPCRFLSHADARKAGWFSRRHQSSDPHREAQARWQAEREAKQQRELSSAEGTAERRKEAK